MLKVRRSDRWQSSPKTFIADQKFIALFVFRNFKSTGDEKFDEEKFSTSSLHCR